MLGSELLLASLRSAHKQTVGGEGATAGPQGAAMARTCAIGTVPRDMRRPQVRVVEAGSRDVLVGCEHRGRVFTETHERQSQRPKRRRDVLNAICSDQVQHRASYDSARGLHTALRAAHGTGGTRHACRERRAADALP